MEYFLSDIINQFQFAGSTMGVEPFGDGHINDTFLVEKIEEGIKSRYILQRINRQIFKDPAGLMGNIHAVTHHLKQKISAAGGDPERETLTLLPTQNGSTYLQTSQGDFWRGYIFINDARTFESVENIDHAYQAAKAFGKFQNLLSDYPPEMLVETIPGFHNTKQRYAGFLEAVARDKFNRVRSSKPEVEFLLEREESVSVLVDKLEKGELPERITHNDTKFNNVLIDDRTGTGVCVIDLDTVMPGLALYDFGDAIRSMANTAAEDERDLSLVNFDLRIFEFFTRGYLEAIGEVLTPGEIKQLSFSVILMTFECGMRFLTDYLQGDHYFKTRRVDHNLDRCRTQFKLVADMETRYDEMQRIVDKYI